MIYNLSELNEEPTDIELLCERSAGPPRHSHQDGITTVRNL
jgi:hypothetical protein